MWTSSLFMELESERLLLVGMLVGHWEKALKKIPLKSWPFNQSTGPSGIREFSTKLELNRTRTQSLEKASGLLSEMWKRRTGNHINSRAVYINCFRRVEWQKKNEERMIVFNENWKMMYVECRAFLRVREGIRTTKYWQLRPWVVSAPLQCLHGGSLARSQVPIRKPIKDAYW